MFSAQGLHGVVVSAHLHNTRWSVDRGERNVSTEQKTSPGSRNSLGGNMRIGWSLGDATLELGMDDKSFGHSDITVYS